MKNALWDRTSYKELIIKRVTRNHMANRTVYVSVTGLILQKPWHIFRFFWHAIRSARQAQKADGIISVKFRNINGVRHTLTVWESERAMQAFLYSGAHRDAIKAFPEIADRESKTCGFETTTIPDWTAAHKIWQDKGKEYQR
ncbi:MAG: hypothetical protein ACRBCJ_14820 [Hyphomicrobiaceae bacterium]